MGKEDDVDTVKPSAAAAADDGSKDAWEAEAEAALELPGRWMAAVAVVMVAALAVNKCCSSCRLISANTNVESKPRTAFGSTTPSADASAGVVVGGGGNTVGAERNGGALTVGSSRCTWVRACGNG